MTDTTPSFPVSPSPRNCDHEPIHIPGSVQPHGLLFVLEKGTGRIVQASANAAELIGRAAPELLGTDFIDLIPADARNAVQRLVTDALTTYVNPFRVPVSTAGGVEFFDGIVHILEEGDTVVELERNPDPGEREATEGLDNYLQIIHRTLAEVAGSTSVDQITDVMAREVKSFTGFDRVMVYRFAPDFHGQVIAEAREPDMEPYLGLHYPATDIPPQARELYLKNQVRLLRSVHAVPAPMVPVLHPGTGKPLDMGRAVLRSMSPVHLQYLRNMGVDATLTISLVVDGRLWGLIACHHRTPRFVSYAIRATASLYAIVMSAHLRAKLRAWEMADLSAARRAAFDVVTRLKDYSDPVGSLGATLPELVKLFAADGGAVLSTAGARVEGSAPESSLLMPLLRELARASEHGTLVTDHTAPRFPALAAALPRAAGMVAIHLGEHAWLVLFRDEAVRKIEWGGDPNPGKATDASGRLQPRSSFAAWQETVRGKSLPWPDITAELTAEVRSGIIELVRKRNLLLERSNQDLHRFAGIVAHEVKNQLHSGIMALSLVDSLPAGALPPEIHKALQYASQALNGLARFTSDMLAFSEAESVAELEDIDFATLAREVVDDLHLSGRTRGTEIRILPLPRIRGPKSQMQHLLGNLLRNALIHAREEDDSELHIEIGTRVDEAHGTVVYVRDDGRGIPPESRERIFDYLYSERSDGTRGSGIGLAFCARVLQRMGHKLWVESELRAGSTFFFSVNPVEAR